MIRFWVNQKWIVRFLPFRSIGIILVFLHAICLPIAWAEEPTPEILIKQVINTYRSLETYRVTGHTDAEITDFNQGGKVSHQTTRFTLLLKKPNGYFITWESDFPPFQKPRQGAAWNTGTQAYVYMQIAKGYMKIPTDLANLQSQAGVSSGSTAIIPELFFTFFPEKDLRISRLNDPVVKGREEIAGEQCYVLEGRNKNMVFTYWISVDNFFIRQHTFHVQNPNGQEMDFELTEEEAKAALRSRGLEPTREQIETVIRMLRMTKKTMQKQRTQIIATDHFSNISLPPVSAQDLQFAVPEGIPLKEDIYKIRESSLDKTEAGRLIRMGTEAIDKNPIDSKAYAQRAQGYRFQNEYPRAIKDLTKAISLDPTQHSSYFQRADAYSRIYSYDLALSDFNEAIRLNPSIAAYYLNRGITYERLQDYDQAILDFKKSLDVDPTFTTAHSYLGNIYIKIREREKGCAYFKKRCDSGNCGEYDAKKANGKCLRPDSELVMLRAKDPAIQKATTAIEQNPRDAKAYWDRGREYVNLHIRDYGRAIQDYTMAVKLDPTYIQAYNFRASAYRYQDQYKLAIKDYNTVLELEPKNGLALSALGNLYLYDLKDRKRGCEYIERYGSPSSSFKVFSVRERGQCFTADSPRYDAAYLKQTIADNSFVLQKDSKNVKAYIIRGMAYADRFEYGRALQDFSVAVSLAPNSVSAYYQRGQVLWQKGQNARAIRDYLRVLTIEPENALAMQALGALYLHSLNRAVIDEDKGCSYFKQACELGVCQGYIFAKQTRTGRRYCPSS